MEDVGSVELWISCLSLSVGALHQIFSIQGCRCGNAAIFAICDITTWPQALSLNFHLCGWLLICKNCAILTPRKFKCIIYTYMVLCELYIYVGWSDTR